MTDPLVAPVVGGTPAYSDEYYLAMAALDNYPIDDGKPKSTSVVFRIHQLGHELERLAVLVPRPEPRELEPLPDIELVAAAVHEAWMVQKRAKGIASAPSQQTGEEQLRPYAELSNEVQEYDRATVRAVYEAIQSARRRDADEERDANALGQKRAIWRHPSDAAVRPASAPSLEHDPNCASWRGVSAHPESFLKRAELQLLRVLVPGGDPQER